MEFKNNRDLKRKKLIFEEEKNSIFEFPRKIQPNLFSRLDSYS